MTMDIDDILASVDRDNYTSPESVTSDHQHLTRLWVAERAVSELLPWPAQLMDRMMERVRKQVENIEDLTASSYEMSNNNNSNNNESNNKNNTLNLNLSILQTDLSRTQYLIRSYLRQRLSKITRFAMHYLVLISPPAPSTNTSTQQTDISESGGGIRTEDTLPNPTSSTTDNLSPSEAHFLYSHQYLLASHYRLSFLASFPPQLRRLDDNAGGTSMIQGPDMREVVLVRCLVPEVPIVVPADEILDQEREGEVIMRMGEVWVGRWEGVRKAWERGDVEIL